MILVGDYIDRGKQSYEMLRWLEQCPPNVLLLRGNHEEEFVSNVDLMQSVDRIEELNTDFSSHMDTVALYESVKYLLCQKKLPAVYFDLYGTIGMLLGQNHVTLYDLYRWAEVIHQVVELRGETKIAVREIEQSCVAFDGYYECLAPMKSQWASAAVHICEPQMSTASDRKLMIDVCEPFLYTKLYRLAWLYREETYLACRKNEHFPFYLRDAYPEIAVQLDLRKGSGVYAKDKPFRWLDDDSIAIIRYPDGSENEIPFQDLMCSKKLTKKVKKEEAAEKLPLKTILYQDVQSSLTFVVDGIDSEDVTELLTSRYFAKNLLGDNAMLYFLMIYAVIRIQSGTPQHLLECLLVACLSDGAAEQYETYKKQFPQESKPAPKEHLLASSLNFEEGGILVVKELLEEKIEQADAKVLKKVIKERGENDIPIALKGLSSPAKKKLFSVLPEHKADELAEECECMGPVRAIDVMAALAELTAVLKNIRKRIKD